MNITYIIGVVAAFGVMVVGMMQGGEQFLTPDQIMNFVDGASVFITIGCTFAVLIASFPIPTLSSIPKHFAVLMNTKKYDPLSVIEKLVELAQVARKNGLLALEEMGNQESDPFFKQCIMLVVDNNDADSSIGTSMGTALITTLYGCVLAHMIFGPIATQLRQRDEEEMLCKLIIVEGIMSIQSGANPKFLREKLLTFLSQKQRGGEGGKKGKE
ncbi:MAG: motility protein A [Lawsonibacter sp.]|nr:motility protein A [Lawsonibacter sp.]